jgi:hypothetical protein
MGRHITAGMDSADQVFTLPAEDSVAAGDLLKITNGGYVRKVQELQALDAQNTALGVTAIKAAYATDVVNGNNYGYTNCASVANAKSIMPTADGGFLHTYPGNGNSGTTYGLNLGSFTPTGVPKLRVSVSASATVGLSRITAAGSSNAAIVYSDNAQLMMAVHNATTGAPLLAPVALAGTFSGPSEDGFTWDLATLASGDVLFAYANGTNLVFKRFNASGALQGVETTVEASVTPKFVAVLPLTNGGFVIRFAKTSVTAGVRIARFNAAGVMQGAIVSITSGSGLYEGASHQTTGYMGSIQGKLIELANGNIVTACPAVLTENCFKVYDASLNLLSTVVTDTGLTSGHSEIMQLAPKLGGGFWVTGANVVLREYSDAGTLLRQSPGGAGVPTRIFDRPGNGPIATFLVNSGSAPSSTFAMNAWKPDLSTTEAAALVIANLPQVMSTYWVDILATGYIATHYVGYSSASFDRLALSYPGPASVIGVAQNAAARGGTVRVATAGKFLVNQTLNSVPFDRRSSTPCGAKGLVFGNTAILSGING